MIEGADSGGSSLQALPATTLGNQPVAQDHAVKVILLSQQFRKQLLVESSTDGFEWFPVQVHAVENRVRRHHRCDSGCKCSFEGDQVLLESVTRENRVPAVGIMGIQAILHRSISHPVLDHTGHTSGVQSCLSILKARNVCLHHRFHQLRVFAKRSINA